MATSLKIQADDEIQRGRGRPRDEVARSRILEAALELMDELGFGNTTTDAIAERAGTSKATIYRRWPNKNELLLEALREAATHELPFPDTGDVHEDIRRQLENFVKWLTGRRGRIFKAFIAAAQSDPGVLETFLNVWMKPRRAEAKLVLERHQQAGRLSPTLDLNLLLDLIYGPIYFRLLAGHGSLCLRYADSIADLALKGLLNQ